MQSASAVDIQEMQAALRRRGFKPGGHGEYRLDGTRFRIDRLWPTLKRTLGRQRTDPLRGQLGRPGLWKRVSDGAAVTCCFEMPPSILADLRENDWGEEADRPFEAALDWAASTAGGKAPKGWTPPSAEEMGMAKTEFIVQHGRFVRRGHVVRGQGLLALRIPIVARLPELDACRTGWLREVLIDGQDRFRMVRIGLDSPDAAVLAEIDLSGAPHSATGSLIRISLDALRGVLIWLVASVDLLADPTVTARALQVCAVRDDP